MFVAWVGGWVFRLRGGRSCAEGDLKGGGAWPPIMCIEGAGGGLRAGLGFPGLLVLPVGMDAITASRAVLV